MSKWNEMHDEEIAAEETADMPDEMTLEEAEAAMMSLFQPDSPLVTQFVKDYASDVIKQHQKPDESTHYFVVCFNNSDQLQEFCDAANLDYSELYMSGKAFMRGMRRLVG